MWRYQVFMEYFCDLHKTKPYLPLMVLIAVLALPSVVSAQSSCVEGTVGEIEIRGGSSGVFRTGDTIELTYQAPGYCPETSSVCRGCLEIRSQDRGNSYFDWDINSRLGQRSVRLEKNRSDTAVGIERDRAFWPALAWVENRDGYPGTQNFALAWRAVPMPDALSLLDGELYAPNDTIRVSVTIDDVGPEGPLNLRIARRAAFSSGGALIAAKYLNTHPISPEGDPLAPGITILEFLAPIAPGRYEIRLQDDQGFVRDAINFDVRVGPLNVVLSQDPAQPSILIAQPVPRPAYISESASVDIAYDQRLGTRFLYFGTTEFDSSQDNASLIQEPLVSYYPFEGGDYRATMFLDIFGPHEYGKPIDGQAMMNFPEKLPEEPRAELDMNYWSIVGDPITISAYVSEELGYESPADVLVYEDGQRYSSEPILTTVASNGEIVELPAELPPGQYEVFLSSSRGSQAPYDLDQAKIVVFPKQGSGEVNLPSGQSYFPLGTIPVRIKIPENVRVGDPTLRMEIVQKGGFTAGCMELAEKFESSTPVTGLAMDLQAPKAPGSYYLRLYKRIDEAIGFDITAPRAMLLAQTEFTVSVPYLDGALVLPDGSQYQIERDGNHNAIVVELNLPVNWPRSDPGAIGANLQLVRMGDVSIDGAIRYPTVLELMSLDYQQDFQAASNTADFTFDRQLTPGHYEVRLTHSGYQYFGTYHDMIISRVPFSVTDSSWVTGIDWPGIPPVVTDIDVNSDDILSLGPAFYQMEYCPTITPLVPENGTQLRFVRLDGQGYSEITDPMKYGYSFFLEAEFNEANPRPEFLVDLVSSGGQSIGQFLVRKTEENPELYRSDLLFAHWPRD